MDYIKQGWNWLVFSSADPQRVSLTVKGVLIGALTYATVLAGFAHIALPSDLLTQLIDQIVNLVQSFLMVVAIITATAGIIRKVGKTLVGTNQAPE